MFLALSYIAIAFRTLFVLESENRAHLPSVQENIKQEIFGNTEIADKGNHNDTSIRTLQFAGYPEHYIYVGTVSGLVNEPTYRFTEGYIHTFLFDGKQLQLSHSTVIDEVPFAMAAWNGRLLIGAGNNLRKAELKHLSSFITSIHVRNDRIYVADSVHLLKYKIKEQTFMELADDILHRYITSCAVLDYHTVIGADKFENIFVSRVPLDIDEEQEEHPYEYKMKMDKGYMNGAPFKMDQICNFYVGEVVTSLQKTSLIATGSEVIVYRTTIETIGALYPFDNKEDIDFFLHLEMYMHYLEEIT